MCQRLETSKPNQVTPDLDKHPSGTVTGGAPRIRSISGGHYNPAVSVMMTAAGKLPRNELLPYVLAQILGGIVAFEIYRRM